MAGEFAYFREVAMDKKAIYFPIGLTAFEEGRPAGLLTETTSLFVPSLLEIYEKYRQMN